MVRILKYAPIDRPDDSDGDPLFDEKRPFYSVAAEDIFDDPTAGLSHRSDVAPKEPARVRLPSVEEFHFDEAAAKSMASKLAPNKKPRIKSRRPRYRSPNRDRWRLPDEHEQDERDEQDDERYAKNWAARQQTAAPRGSGRGLFWSFCASILIVTGTSAAFGFVQPLNDLLPKRMGDFLSNISENLGASLFVRADTSADIEVAGDTAASGPRPLIPPVIPDRPMATAVVARPVSTTSIAVEVRPSAISGGSGLAEPAELPGATSEKAFELGATVLKPGKIDGAEFATSKSAAALAAAAAPAAAPATPESAAAPAAAPDEGNEDNPRKSALHQSVKADPLPIPSVPAIAREPVTSEPQPVISPLSAAQIDDLLARGEELLQSGDIASARLAFLRVAAAGDRRGAKGVGMTYDPRVYARLRVTGLAPDREQAEFWYRKAGETATFATESNIGAETGKSQEPGSVERNAACARKYSSFEPSTGLYTAHSGVKRPCRLP